jgi:hypothetical protein
MAAESLVKSKLDASVDLANSLLKQGSPLLSAFWDYDNDLERWTLVLVPKSRSDERRLIEQASTLLIEQPYRGVFSLSDPTVDGNQIDRARALGAYIRFEPYVGRRIDTTFTDGEYFESVVPVYFSPELMTRLSVA